MNEQPQPVTQTPPETPAPMPQLQPTQPVSPVPRKSNKGLIALLVGIGLLGLLIGIGCIVYFTMFYISKGDYQRATAQTNTVIDHFNSASKAADEYNTIVENAAATDTQINGKKMAYESAYASYLTSVDTLSKERALKNSKVKAAYDKFATKNKAFTDSNATMVDTMTTIHKVAVSCSESTIGNMNTGDVSKLVAAYDAAFAPCLSAMRELSISKNTDAAKVGSTALSYFDEMRTQVVAMQAAYNAKDRAKFESAYNAYMLKANSFTSDTDMAAVKKHLDSLSPTDELNSLATTINAQL